jgi:hypothetical protein
MKVTLDLSPETEARLLAEAQQEGVPVATLIAQKVGEPLPAVASEGAEAAQADVQRLLAIVRRFDQLPRNPNLGPELEWDESGLPL